MNDNYSKFYASKKQKIKEFEIASNVNDFLDDVQKLYPTMNKLFEEDTLNLIKEKHFFKKFERLKLHVFNNILPNIESFSVGLQKMEIKKRNQLLEFPVTNPIKFMNTYLGTNKDDPDFYLILSFLLLPQNYDIIQLCDKKIN